MKCEEAMMYIKKAVDAELVRFFARKRLAAAHIDRSAVVLVHAIADLTCRGGKRIRPFLCWLGYQAATHQGDSGNRKEDSRNQRLMHAMIGLELFQSFALIHDDIMDESDERRGGKSVHAYFAQKTYKLSLPHDFVGFGRNMGILAGDLAFAWADEEMNGVLDSGNRKEDSRNLMMIYQKMKEEVMYGQALDVLREAGISDVTKEHVDELKTAWYSVVRPLQIGSSLAAGGTSNVPATFDCGATRFREFQTLWEAWGVPVGKLFQLRDDFLDEEIDEEIFEKKKATLQKKADQALADAVLTDDIRALLTDIVQFVSTRKS